MRTVDTPVRHGETRRREYAANCRCACGNPAEWYNAPGRTAVCAVCLPEYVTRYGWSVWRRVRRPRRQNR